MISSPSTSATFAAGSLLLLCLVLGGGHLALAQKEGNGKLGPRSRYLVPPLADVVLAVSSTFSTPSSVGWLVGWLSAEFVGLL